MSTTLTGNFEVAGKVDGNAVSAGDAGALTQWDDTSGALYSSDAAHGALSAHMTASGHMRWENGSHYTAQTDFYARSVWKSHDNGSLQGIVPLATLVVSARGNDWVYIVHSTDGKIRVWDRTGSVVATSANVYAYDAWHRMEAHYVIVPGDSPTGSNVTVRLYNGMDDGSPTETLTVTGIDMGSISAYVGNGIFSFNPINEFRVDDFGIQYGAGATWLGPIVPAAPTADFTGTPLAFETDETCSFTDASTGTPTGWTWSKSSDGVTYVPFSGTPNAQNPTESFTAGTWSIKLVATNAGGSDTKTRANYVVVSPLTAPVANFTSAQSPQVSVAFTDTSTTDSSDPILTRHWEKNNGSGWVDFAGSPTAANPTELFTLGTWSVRLTVTNEDGTNTKTSTNLVVVSTGGSGGIVVRTFSKRR